MKHELSACILIPTLAVLYSRLKQGLKYMHSVRVLSRLLVSVLFISVLTSTENLKFFLHLFVQLFLASMQSYSYACTIESMLFLLDNSMAIIWWLDYIKFNLLITLCISLVITIALKCHSCSNYKLWTELSFQVFYSLSIPIFFENS